MEYRHVNKIRNGAEAGDIYKMFVFEESNYERAPYGPEVDIYAHDYDGYYDDEGTHHSRFLWGKSRGNRINIAITEEHYVPNPEADADRAQYIGKDGVPLRVVETTLLEENVGAIEVSELYSVIERLINKLE
jgi:hypothetical protein